MRADFRPAILAYAAYVILQFATGTALYWWKVGPQTADAVEYYLGSEAALKRFPERPDRFVAAKTPTGLLKTQAPHTIAFGTMFFVLIHLVRSLGMRQSIVRFAGTAFGLFALLDFFLPFLLLMGFDLFAWRFPVLLLFCASGCALTLLLCSGLRSSV